MKIFEYAERIVRELRRRSKDSPIFWPGAPIKSFGWFDLMAFILRFWAFGAPMGPQGGAPGGPTGV